MSLLAFYLILIAVVLVAVAVFNPPLRCLAAILFVLCRLTEFYPIRALLLTQIDNLF